MNLNIITIYAQHIDYFLQQSFYVANKIKFRNETKKSLKDIFRKFFLVTYNGGNTKKYG